jgi:hypothetical protein
VFLKATAHLELEEKVFCPARPAAALQKHGEAGRLGSEAWDTPPNRDRDDRLVERTLQRVIAFCPGPFGIARRCRAQSVWQFAGRTWRIGCPRPGATFGCVSPAPAPTAKIIPRDAPYAALVSDASEPLADGSPHALPVQTADIGLFEDIPAWIWPTFLSAWAIFFGLFIIFFTTDAATTFVVTITAFFATMAFGLPMTLAAQSECGNHKCNGMIPTHTGPLDVQAAGIQIALIPIGGVIGLIAYIVLAM